MQRVANYSSVQFIEENLPVNTKNNFGFTAQKSEKCFYRNGGSL